MSDKFYPIPAKQLLQIILKEYSDKQSIFGIPNKLFFNPNKQENLRINQFNKTIATPIGVAACPHSQMSQNIIGAWLTGARYIELKTIQTLDNLEIAKPCIDMQDEGYNCEWSQELLIKESFSEYLKAWVIIHILNHKFGYPSDIQTIFNMSVGYNLDGILQKNVQWFFQNMHDATEQLSIMRSELAEIYPNIDKLDIPTQISDNITLSTMHGCPAGEIQDIAQYLLTEKKLHTYVKLNPTLLGAERLREILNNKLNFKTAVPDVAFEHDLKYADAVKIIRNLQHTARTENLNFGLKLTNTLESLNNKNVFGTQTDMMYMSGRALHPIAINVAQKLQSEFNGELELSFSAGADAFNIAEVLKCGFKTVTVCSDILKPGGYMRLNQYFENINSELQKHNAQTISEAILKDSNQNNLNQAALVNLTNYAETVLKSDRYKRKYRTEPDIKSDRTLRYFDCISAPCSDTCATHQDIPEYMHHTAAGNYDKAYHTILKTNSMPVVTGIVCDHLCQNKCTRINYDNSVLIREVKRFVSEQAHQAPKQTEKHSQRVAVIGAGPAGLSCAYYLSMSGVYVDIFESKEKAGGMVQHAIPGFRLTDEQISTDIQRVTELGAKIHYAQKINAEKFDALRNDYDFVFASVGAQNSAPFALEGIEASGVLDSLQFLFSAKKHENTGIGNNVVIIGGGNTAMDAARTAFRLVNDTGKVTVVYRRTINEMPADDGEIKGVIEEGIEITELASPERVIVKNGHVSALVCSRMTLSEPDSSGRARPIKIKDSEFEIPCDTIIPAVGQSLDIDFANTEFLKAEIGDFQTKFSNVYIGGDALRGAATAIKAIADGRQTAEKILKKIGIFDNRPETSDKNHTKNELMLRRAKRSYAQKQKELDVNDRKNFKVLTQTLDEHTIRTEADRCLHCDEICNICTTVCPNFANYSYDIEPITYNLHKVTRSENGEQAIENDSIFSISQKYQIINIANFCNECGNCNTFCPTNSAPYKEKPKLHLTTASFEASKVGFMFENSSTIMRKQNESISKLRLLADVYLYETEHFSAELSVEDFSIRSVVFTDTKYSEARFTEAAEMSILLKQHSGLFF